MANNNRKYLPRPPRHEAALSDGLVQVHRGDQQGPEGSAAGLIDFSRQGLRVRCRETYQVGERLLIQLYSEGGLVLQRPVTIRWLSSESAAETTYGCAFDHPVSWEELGELLLRGVLSMD